MSGNQGSRDGPLLFTSPFGGHCVVLAVWEPRHSTSCEILGLFSFFNKKENNFCIVLSKGGQQNILKPTFDFLYAIFVSNLYILFSCLHLKPINQDTDCPRLRVMLPEQAPSSTQARNIHENTRVLELQRIHPDFDTTETFFRRDGQTIDMA